MPNVRESFWQILPTLPQTLNPNAYRRITAGYSTRMADPPRAIIGESYVPLVNRALTGLEVRDHTHDDALLKEMPQEEDSHWLHTEADVIRAATLYLLHPVNV